MLNVTYRDTTGLAKKLARSEEAVRARDAHGLLDGVDYLATKVVCAVASTTGTERAQGGEHSWLNVLQSK